MSGASLMDMAADLIPDRWGLSANEKHVLTQLGRVADYRTDNADVGLPYVARRTGLSVDTVRRCLRVLADNGWIAIVPQDRPNGATSSNLYVVNYDQLVNAATTQRNEDAEYRAQWRERFARQAAAETRGENEDESEGAPSTVQGGAGSAVQGGPSHSARGKYSNQQSINTLSAQAQVEFDYAVMLAAGDAVDVTAPAIVVTYALAVMLQLDKPCTVDDIIAGVTKAAAWYRKRGLIGKMRNWDKAVEMACEYRDLRLTGPVLRAKEASKGEGIGDPAALPSDKWPALIAVSNHRGGKWSPEWGPPPGADGSFVPVELVELWKGVMA